MKSDTQIYDIPSRTFTKKSLSNMDTSNSTSLQATKQPVINNQTVRYIHDSVLGITLGYLFYNDMIIYNVAFTHKKNKAQGSKPDMFSRKIGRNITSQRINDIVSFMNGSARNAPSSVSMAKVGPNTKYDVELRRRIEDNIYIQIDAIKGAHYGYNYRTTERIEQLKNDYIKRVIDGVITNAVK